MKKFIYLLLFALLPFGLQAQTKTLPKTEITYAVGKLVDCDCHKVGDPHYYDCGNGYYDQYCNWHWATRRQIRLMKKAERLQKKIQIEAAKKSA